MSLQVCEGENTGFPIKLNQTMFDPWPGVKYSEVQRLVVPSDIQVAWAPPTTANISATYINEIFHIGGFDSIASGTTLTLGSATYTCSPTLTLCGIQHGRLVSAGSPTNEVILAFVIQRKNDNPSSPDIVLMCRPAILSDNASNSHPLWKSVDSAVKNNTASSLSGFDLSSLFAYNRDVMMPMMSYETCIATQLIGGPNKPAEGSTKVRVVVCSQPINIFSEPTGTQKCSRVAKYTLPESDGRLLFNVFSSGSAAGSGYTKIQFSDRKADNGATNAFPPIPSPPANFLVLGLAGRTVDDWANVLQTFEYLVDPAFVGKSFAEIARAQIAPVKKKGKKAFKCYTIDPRKDVVGDQILIDPATGQPLKDTMDSLNSESAGGDPALALALGGQALQSDVKIQPGDIEEWFVYIISTIGGLLLLAYLFYIIRIFVAQRYSDGITHVAGFCGCFLILFALTFGLDLDSKNRKSKK